VNTSKKCRRARPWIRLWAVPCLVLAAAIPAAAQQGGSDVMTMRESLLLPTWGSYQLSPDGRTLAYTKSVRDTTEFEATSHIWLYDIASSAHRQLTNSEDGETSPRWLDDGRLLFRSSRDDEARLWVISPNGGEAARFTDDDDAPNGTLSDDGTRILFTKTTEREDDEEWKARVERKDDAYYAEQKLTWSHVWVYDVATGDSLALTQGEFDNGGASWSPDGQWVAYSSNRTGTGLGDPNRSNNSDLFVIPSTGGAERQLTTSMGPDRGAVFSPDNHAIAYGSSDRENHSADQTDLKVVTLDGGEPLNLTADFDYSVSGIRWTPDGEHLYFEAAHGLRTPTYRVRSDGSTEPEEVFPDDGYRYRVADHADDESIWIITGVSLSDAGTVFISRDGGRSMERLFTPNADRPFRTAAAETLTWEGADGWSIEGVLTYPLDYVEGRSYPTILQVHGGPFGRFQSTYNASAQIWAARGYAVLQGNPRGSSGRTLAFGAANQGDWGGKDFEDLMKGVDHVVGMGVADPDQLAVMGGSYGGFMTFWAVSQTDRFKAAIGHAAISDWYAFYGETDIPNLLEYGFDGLPWRSRENYEQWSPIRYAEDVVTPLLITHGEEDLRVPITQGEKYYRALKKMGKPVEFLRFPREGHGISEPRHRIFLDQEQAKWIERYIRSRPIT
jgi:dipeptidyl aminopeptidase/acylaminoacyl peptidase